MENVTVLMPVGPNYNPEWLQEAFTSAVNQTYAPDEILLIDDGADLFNGGDHHYPFSPGQHMVEYTHYSNGKLDWFNKSLNIKYNIWRCPANVGFTAAFNLGVGLSDNDLVVYLATDDKLMPTAIERAVQTWEDNNRKDAWYAFTYVDSNGVEGNIPNNAAMITKGLWKGVGGYPPAAFVGPDAAVLSCLMAHASDRIIKVDDGTPLYWIRDHAGQETKTHTWRFSNEMTLIRNKLTEDFKWKD